MSPLLFHLEKDIAELLLYKLEHLQITPQRAAQISRFVLSALPQNLSDGQIRKIIPSLDDKFFELAEVVHKYLWNFHEGEKYKVADNAEFLIKKGKIKEATKLMQDYFRSKNIWQ